MRRIKARDVRVGDKIVSDSGRNDREVEVVEHFDKMCSTIIETWGGTGWCGTGRSFDCVDSDKVVTVR